MKTFELKIVINVKTEEGLENIDDLKHMILSGKIQREWFESGMFEKVKATIKEIK
jgi:hypothetical protein